MKEKRRFNLMEELANRVKEGQLVEILDACDLPHKEVFNRLVEMHHKAKDEAKREGREAPGTDLEHIGAVVQCMGELMEGDYTKILDLDSKCIGTERLKRLKRTKEFESLREVVENLNKEAKELLLCTALYHDIGKAIIRPRHGPEGADIIKDSGYKDREMFYDLGFRRSDIFLMSDLIRFHDYLGMLGTGETSYLTFTELLYAVTNPSIAVEERFLDYLVLLNLVDIAGTIGKISCEDFVRLIHDFELIKKAHEDISRKVYEDIFKEKPKGVSWQKLHKKSVAARDLIDVMSELQRLAENSTSERLRRMLRAALKTGVEQIDERELDNYEEWVRVQYERVPGEYPKPKELKEWFAPHDIIPIVASLRGLNIGQAFYTQFAFICKFDYLHGFIRDLFKQMIRIELNKNKNEDRRRSPHDLRRDLALCVIELINTLVDLFGGFTSNNTRIGLGFERFTKMDQHHKERLLRRITGEDGVFKQAEACTKIRNSTNLWIIIP